MLSPEEYTNLVNRLGGGEDLSEEQRQQIRAYECAMQDKKYNREHTDEHL